MICELTGMDVSNASVYDGATAAAEAAAMCRDRKRTRDADLRRGAHPDVIDTIRTYCCGSGTTSCASSPKRTERRIWTPCAMPLTARDVPACTSQQPNFFGLLEDAERRGEIMPRGGREAISWACNPIALAVLKTPAECGADIAVGEGQPLGHAARLRRAVSRLHGRARRS